MSDAAAMMDQASQAMNEGRYPEATQAYLAAVRAAPGDDQAWLGLGLSVVVQRQFPLVPTLVEQRNAVRGDGFAFFHDLATSLMTYRLHPLMLGLSASLAPDSPYQPSALYYAACCHLLAGAEDQAFALLARLKPLLAERLGSLPIAPEDRFNIAYRQATLVEDGPYIDALDPAALAAIGSRLPPLERVGEWHMPSPGGVTLLAACDGHYLERFAADFLRSAECHGEDLCVHLHVVEPVAGGLEAVRELARGFSRIQVNLSAEPANPLRSGAYYACSRFLVAPEIAAHGGGPLMTADIDVVFEQPLAATVAAALPFDVAGFVQDGFGPCSRLPAVLRWFGATAAGRASQDALRRFILSKLEIRWPLNWMLDQAGLMAVHRWLRTSHPQAAIGNLTQVLDGPFTTILSCRGDADEKAALIRAAGK